MTKQLNNGKEYEKLIDNLYRQLSPNAVVTLNDSILGHISETRRQVDVSIRHKILNQELLTVIEAKDYGKPVSVKVLDGFVTFLRDVKADYGILISAKGFSKAAKTMGKNLGIECLSIHSALNKNWETIVKVKVTKTIHDFDIINDFVLMKVPEGKHLNYVPGVYSYDKENLLNITGVIRNEILMKHSWKELRSSKIIRSNPKGNGLYVVMNDSFVLVEKGDIAIKYKSTKKASFTIFPENYVYEVDHIKGTSTLHNLDITIENLTHIFKNDYENDPEVIGNSDIEVEVFKYNNGMIAVTFRIKIKGNIIGDFFYKGEHLLEATENNERFVELEKFLKENQHKN